MIYRILVFVLIGGVNMSYLVCDKCKSYYELQKGELPNDFSDKCDCGGKLTFEHKIKGVNDVSSDIANETKTIDEDEEFMKEWDRAHKIKPTKEDTVKSTLNSFKFVFKIIMTFMMLLVGFLFPIGTIIAVLALIFLWYKPKT